MIVYLLKRVVEIIVAKGEIAHLEHFNLYVTILSKPLPHIECFLTPLQQMTFENIVAKSKISHNEQFHLLPQSFQLTFENYALCYR